MMFFFFFDASNIPQFVTVISCIDEFRKHHIA